MEHLYITPEIKVIVPRKLRPYKEEVRQFFEDVVVATRKNILEDTNTW